MSNEKKYTQKFRVEWLSDERYKNWLQKIEGENTKCRCKYCNCILSAKSSDIEKHCKTQKHIKAGPSFSVQQSSNILRFVKNSSVHRTEGNMALFIAESCPISHADKLTKFCTANFSDSKSCNNLTLGRTKCSAIISNVLAPHFKENLIVDIGDTNYSLLIDESNDITVSKLLGIVIRYYSQNKKCITTTFLDLVPLRECNAEAICEAIKFSLKKNSLDLQKLIAIGTDNASVMTGINNGVYAKLKAEIPSLILVHCLCHSLQLAISHATKEGLPRNIEFFIKETFNWFSHSAIRQSKYKKLYSSMNDGNEPLKLIQCSETRWMSIQTAIDRILKQWNELKENFNLAKTNERCYTAEILFSMFDDQRIFLFLLFLKPVVDEVHRLTKIFESDNNDPTKLLQDLLNLIESCCSKIVIPGIKITNDVVIENYLAPNPYLGYQFETEINNSTLLDEEKKNIRSHCIAFLLSLIKQLRQRLPDNISILQTMTSLSIDRCLNPIKKDIINLAKMFFIDDAILARIDFQWRKIHTIQWTETSSTLNLWMEVTQYRDAAGENPFQDLVSFVLKILLLPHSNAEVERLFSQMNIVKTKLRNRLNIISLSSILMIRSCLQRLGKSSYDYELPENVIGKIGTMKSYQSLESEPGPSFEHNEEMAEIEEVMEFNDEWTF